MLRLPKLPVRLLVAVALSSLSVAMVLQYTAKADQTARNRYRSVNVVVAAADIAENTIVKSNMVRVVGLPSSLATTGTTGAISAVVGKVAVVAMQAGDPVTSRKLAEPGSQTSRYVDIPAGMRAVTITPDDSDDAISMVRLGDHVDLVLATESGSYGDETSEVLDNIELARTQDPAAAGSSKSAEPQAKTVTVLVTVAQAQRLTAADTSGSIRLLLRPRDAAPSPQAAARPYGGTALPVAESRPQAKPAKAALAPSARRAVVATRAAANAPAPAGQPRVAAGQAPATPPSPPVSTTVEVIRGLESSAVSVTQ